MGKEDCSTSKALSGTYSNYHINTSPDLVDLDGAWTSMHHDLNIVAAWIDYKCGIVSRVILGSFARLPIALAARLQSSFMEFLDGLDIWRAMSGNTAVFRRLTYQQLQWLHGTRGPKL